MTSRMHFKDKIRTEKVFLLSIFLMIWFALILISGLKPIGFDPDSENYIAVLKYDPSEYNLLVFEPFHWALVYLNNILFDSNAHMFFTLYAVIFLSISLYTIYKDSISPSISLLVFVLLFFPNFGLIQIRQGVSLALFLCSIKDLSQDRMKHFLIKALIATGFHYASPILFLLLFISRKIKLSITILFILPILCFILGKILPVLSMLSFLTDLIGGAFGYKLKQYLLIMEQFGKEHIFNVINPFNSYTLFIFGCGAIFGYLYKKDIDKNKMILLNSLFLGFSWFFLFLSLPTLSFRVFYPLSTMIIFILPYIIYKTKPRIVAVTLLILLILAVSFNMYIRHDLFNFDMIL